VINSEYNLTDENYKKIIINNEFQVKINQELLKREKVEYNKVKGDLFDLMERIKLKGNTEFEYDKI